MGRKLKVGADKNKNVGASRLNEVEAPLKPQDKSLKGWSSRLSIFVSAVILIEGSTGLWIYLSSFSVPSQVQVLIHTVAGLLLVIPFLIYQIKHYLDWYKQNLTVVLALGYALMIMVLLSIVSGLVVTYQAGFGSRLSQFWDLTHLISGIAVPILLVVHLMLAYARRRVGFMKIPENRRPIRRFVRGSALIAAVIVLAIIGFTYLNPSVSPYIPIPDDYTIPGYMQAFDEYRGSPFAPTYARTNNGQFVNPEVLANSESCGSSRCHEQILAEWQPSAHRFSAMNPPFQAVQRNFAEDRSAAETRYCAGCHDPISLFAGAKDIQNMDLSAPGMQEGNSCVVCHSISKVDQRGNADYELTPPRRYLWEASSGVTKFLSDFLLRAYPRQHLADYDRNLLRTPEFCGRLPQTVYS